MAIPFPLFISFLFASQASPFQSVGQVQRSDGSSVGRSIAFHEVWLRQWLQDSSLTDFDMRSIIDWEYYKDSRGPVLNHPVVEATHGHPPTRKNKNKILEWVQRASSVGCWCQLGSGQKLFHPDPFRPAKQGRTQPPNDFLPSCFCLLERNLMAGVTPSSPFGVPYPDLRWCPFCWSPRSWQPARAPQWCFANPPILRVPQFRHLRFRVAKNPAKKTVRLLFPGRNS